MEPGYGRAVTICEKMCFFPDKMMIYYRLKIFVEEGV